MICNRFIVAFILAWLVTGCSSHGVPNTTETIVLMRHGEKPDGGLGQLNCQGLNRALALPQVLQGKYGRPAAIFVPNPGEAKSDEGHEYNYIRPLATIEPMAIQLGLPVNTQWGFDDIRPLNRTLAGDEYSNATVFVVWQHRYLIKIAKDVMRDMGGDPYLVPDWRSDDFDSMYVITVHNDANGKRHATLRIDHQGLNNLSAVCPGGRQAK